jgi:hypothetical protein
MKWIERYARLRPWQRVVVTTTIVIALVIAAGEIGWRLGPYLE